MTYNDGQQGQIVGRLPPPLTLETEPLHFQFPPTKNLRPDMRDALEVNPRATWAAGAFTADAADANMIRSLCLPPKRRGEKRQASGVAGVRQAAIGSAKRRTPDPSS